MPFSVQYPIVELLTGLLTLHLWLKFSASINFLLYLYFISALIILSFIDLKYLLIPDVVVLPGIGLGILFNFINNNLINALFGLVLGGGLIFLVRTVGGLIYKKEVMGFGDVELSAMIGAYLGFKYTFIAILLAAVIGAIVGGLYLILTKKERQTPIPFGPFLSIGSVLSLFIEGLNPPILRLFLP